MIEVEILKSLDGRDQVETFSNRYLFSGTDDTTNNDAEQTARNCAYMESLLYFQNCSFVRAVVRRLDPLNRVVRNNTRSFPLDLLGTQVLAVGETLAPAHIVAVYEKAAILGRPGLSRYRHCTRSGEFKAWTDARTKPARFDTVEGTIGAFIEPIPLLMINAIGENALVHSLPDPDGVGPILPRPIVVVRFTGFRMDDPVRPHGSAGSNQLKAAQQKINELAAKARYASNPSQSGSSPALGASLVIELKAKASAVYWDLELEFRARIKWPAIFGDAPNANVLD